MFDEALRELRRLKGGHDVVVQLASDADGFFDRECPSPECLFVFKVHEEDWRDKVRDDEVFCPFCGHTADSANWWTKKQIKHIEKVAIGHLQRRLRRAMKRDADRWNRRQSRDSLVSITMQVDDHPRQVRLPPAVAEPMRLKIACPVCACRYAVIGAAFFCPACGHNAADLMFSQSISGIRTALDALASVRSAIPDRDTAETTTRLIIENGLQNAVTAFQRYAETLYARYPSLPKPRRNVFQNLAEGSILWQAASGKQYFDYLNAPELVELSRYFQQRHLLAHSQGLVDAPYITRSGDTSYRAGQRLVIREASVRACLTLIEKLAAAMASEVVALGV